LAGAESPLVLRRSRTALLKIFLDFALICHYTFGAAGRVRVCAVERAGLLKICLDFRLILHYNFGAAAQFFACKKARYQMGW